MSPPTLARPRYTTTGGTTSAEATSQIEQAVRAAHDRAATWLADHIKKIVDAAPPATPDQIVKLTAILQTGATGEIHQRAA